MRPVDQLVHEDGCGDCLRACVASIVETGTAALPNWAEDGSFVGGACEWLWANGFAYLKVHFAEGAKVKEYTACPGHFCVLGGISPRRRPDGSIKHHAVVGRANGWSFEVLHDPHPSRDGIIGDPTFALWIWRVKWPLTHEKYTLLIDDLREAARECGYALAVHGSLGRDIDLIAAPWSDMATSAAKVAETIRKAAEHRNGKAYPYPHEDSEYFRAGCPGAKSHGRLCWSWYLDGPVYLDLSVMPRSNVTAMEMLEAYWKLPAAKSEAPAQSQEQLVAESPSGSPGGPSEV